MMVTVSNLTGIVDRLEEKKVVSRKRDENDRRAVRRNRGEDDGNGQQSDRDRRSSRGKESCLAQARRKRSACRSGRADGKRREALQDRNSAFRKKHRADLLFHRKAGPERTLRDSPQVEPPLLGTLTNFQFGIFYFQLSPSAPSRLLGTLWR